MSSSVAVSDTPTRDHDEENFPTASLLLAPAQRARVMAFYRFVRTADDIADSAELPPAAKLAIFSATNFGTSPAPGIENVTTSPTALFATALR